MKKQKLLISSIINISFRQMGMIYKSKNPIFLFVFLVSCVTLVILSKQIFYQTDKILLYFQMTFWLWTTLFLSSLIESVAILQNPDFQLTKVKNVTIPIVKKLSSNKYTIGDFNNYTEVPITKIKTGNLILLKTGDEVPFDGEVISGMCYVSDVDATGSSDHRLKSKDKDNILVAGSVIESDDFIIMKVRSSMNKSFFKKISKLLQNIERQAMPSEIAFERLMLGLSILFIVAMLVIWVIADYSGLRIPIIYLIELIVVLLPTTIFALQKATIYYSQSNLALSNIKVQDQVAFDNASDINIVLVDKTGTLTIGQRQMADFDLIAKDVKAKDYLKYLYLSSIEDDTAEGKSIVSFVSKQSKSIPKTTKHSYQYFPFSASKPISGCNYGKLEIRKGSLKAVAKYLGKTIGTLPKEVKKSAAMIAKTYGTPMLLVVNNKIIGVINLQDRLRRGVIKSIKNIQNAGMDVAILTGDNTLTASHIAKELGINTVYADNTPEKKLKIVRSLQKKGYIVAMCGDGVNDALALAQADIGYTFEDNSAAHSVLSSNIISKHYDLSGLLKLRKECQKITMKRGKLTIFSITSDLSKYFVIVPAIFTTAFPVLSNLNIMNFKSLESVVLSALIFNSLTIPSLAPLIFSDRIVITKNRKLFWRTIFIYGVGGIISPFLFIKLIEIVIYEVGLI